MEPPEKLAATRTRTLKEHRPIVHESLIGFDENIKLWQKMGSGPFPSCFKLELQHVPDERR